MSHALRDKIQSYDEDRIVELQADLLDARHEIARLSEAVERRDIQIEALQSLVGRIEAIIQAGKETL